jgi:hypothetical protein
MERKRKLKSSAMLPGIVSGLECRAARPRRSRCALLERPRTRFAASLTLSASGCYGSEHMRGSLRKTVPVLLVIVVLLILAYRSRSAIKLEAFEWSQLKSAVLEADFRLLLASLVSIYAAYFVRAVRWTRFSRYLPRATFSHILECTYIGFTALFLLGRAGEPVRPLLIARRDRIPVSSAFGIYFLERIFDVASTVVILGLSLLSFPGLLETHSGQSAVFSAIRASGIGLLAGLPVLIGFLVWLRLHGGGFLARKIALWRAAGRLRGARARVAGLLEDFTDGLQSIRTWGDLLAALATTALHWSIIVLIYYMVSHSFAGSFPHFSVASALLVLAMTMVGSTLQLPGVGGGSQLASFIAFTVVLGVEKEPAAAASVVIWLITFASVSLAGLPLLLREGWSMGELRRLAREEKQAEAEGGHAGSQPAPSAPLSSQREES